MQGLNLPFRSEVKDFIAGSAVELGEFVPLRGPNGGRVVIDDLIVRITGVITVATAAWNGYDVPRLIQTVTVEESGSLLRWSTSGLFARYAAEQFCGEDYVIDHANVAVGAAQAIDVSLMIPFEKPNQVRPKDTSMASDMFRKITINPASLAQAQTGTTVLSAPALKVYVLATWHEEESALELKVVDQVTAGLFSSTEEARVMCQGPIHDLFLARQASTAGGDVVSAITDVRVDELNIPLMTRTDLIAYHTYKRRLGNTGIAGAGAEYRRSLVRSGFVLPIIASNKETSTWDGRVVKSIKLNATSAPAGCSYVMRQILPRDQNSTNMQFTQFGSTDEQIDSTRVKTEGKSKRDLKNWSMEKLKFATLSLPLSK